MSLNYADIVLLNSELQKQGTRYRISWKNEETACIQPPGECCLTAERNEKALRCIQDFYARKGIAVRFSQDGLYFTCCPMPGPQAECQP